MFPGNGGLIQFLFIGAASRICALRIPDVVEVLRPLPVDPIPPLSAGLLGLSIIRGEPVPVVDLRILLASAADRPPRRFVVVKAGPRRLALAADEVLGVRRIGENRLVELPPAIREGCEPWIEALATRDQELCLVLKSTRLVPEEVWSELSENVGGPR